MKYSLFILSISLLSFHTGLIAQKAIEGVYLSANDFTNGKIAFSNDSPGKKYQLCMNEFSDAPSIKITLGVSVITLAKDSIFGYRDKKGTSYRFYKNDLLTILNPAEKILLYSKTSRVGSPRNINLVTNYYFSETAGSPIYALTKHNLSVVFGKDVHFMELLNMYFHFDSELTAYDSQHKVYFLNFVFNESKLESEESRNKINEYESKCSIFYNYTN
jgi:hypothetical protein